MPPSRSRSLDGLLDEPAPVEQTSETIEDEQKEEEAVAAMLGQYDVNLDETDANQNQSDTTSDEFPCKEKPHEGISKSRSYQENLDAESLDRGSMLSLPNADAKRKRNFMDKCVSKVRHLIKK